MVDHASKNDIPERLLTGYTGRLSIVLAVGALAITLGRQLLPLLLPTIMDELAITPSKAGFVLTVMWGLFALLQYPAGRLSDELSRTTVVTAGFGLMILGFASLVGALSYPLLLFGVALVGVGAGLAIISMRTLLSELFVERRGQAIGINTAAAMGGGVFAAALAVSIHRMATWQAAFVPVVGILSIVLVSFHRGSDQPYVISRVDLRIHGTLSRVFGSKRIRRLLVVYSSVIFTWQATFGFLPVYLRIEKGFSPVFASVSFAIPFAIGVVAMPAAGRISDLLSRPPVIVSAIALGIVGLTTMIATTTVFTIVAGIAVFAVGMTSFLPVMQAYLMDIFPDANVGGDFGAFRTIYIGIGSLGPSYVGLIAERASYTLAFSGLIVCLFLGATVVIAAGATGPD